MTILTVYPNPDPETTSCDGDVRRVSSTSWADARTGSTGNTAAASSTILSVKTQFATDPSQWLINRAFILFDTSALGAGVIISSAVLSLAGDGNAVTDTDTDTLHVVSATPASNTDLVSADFVEVGSTSFASKALASWVATAGTYNDFTLNASGIANISLTGISKFALRMATDLNNSTPTGLNDIRIRASEIADTTSDPKLVITYTTSAIKTFNGVAMASVKTINGVAMASIKTWNGVA